MEDQVREYFQQTERTSTGPDVLCLQVLKDLADVIVRPLLIIVERLRILGKILEDWKRTNVTPIFKKSKKEDLGKYRLFSLTSVPERVMKEILLKTISKHVEDKKVNGSSQHGFMRGKCLTNLL